ncbi:DsbA family protein [Laspinema olomoucense]|uniref:Thioredoxin domain-containing protein n=1 Tax=Laspinema olomoucense D3b TaxID=2953688 RepID=A0ABT2NAU7_9CYAN|nr:MULTISPECIES: thioredoxin domain-containing protein [unclassified Laspinema]MCT7974061.1 thioredoxin domain-containing protein [Laspinema sp. D3d]MCT7978470.1 thioredoxin domain-containing protein [Laspinema sp. D3b]MCT7991105.1 thioredoxin domain-containing protein [Laspinema sp. D3a]MCT7997044.1 thioredoxin domain-containing protein [Laspinema sp. D3c]
MSPVRFFSLTLACCLIFGFGLFGCTSPQGTSANSDLEAQVLEIIRNNPQVIIESVQAYQEAQQNEVQEARQAFLQQMSTNPGAIIGNSPVKGAPQRNIVIVEFSDFQCPFCAKAHETVNQFMAKHQAEVTLTYKHLPLTQIHTQALPAAKAAWAAGQQGKFWEYHDSLFQQQEQLAESLYGTIAQKLNLDLEKFNSDRQSEAAQAAIEEDLILARKLGINGTPFFFMNEEPFSGAVELSEMETILARIKSAGR